jgi:putative ABC transport system ATP-binding protein
MIEIRQVKKNYRMGETEVPALRGVDLRVEQGEFLAVWGPSGSGKTTLLNLIGAIDEPTSGQVFLGGKDVANLSDNKRSALRNETLGFIFQGFNPVS